MQICLQFARPIQKDYCELFVEEWRGGGDAPALHPVQREVHPVVAFLRFLAGFL